MKMFAVIAVAVVATGSALSLSRDLTVQGKCFEGLAGKSSAELCTALNASIMAISTPESEDPNCKEPKNPAKDIEGLGLTRVYCCETAKAKVAELTARKDRCAMAAAGEITMPCWKSLQKVLPDYIAYYTKLGNELCATPFPTPAANGTNNSSF